MASSKPANSSNTPELGRWTTGLFDCFSDIGNCCTTLLCPCIIFGQIADIVDKGSPNCFISARNYGVLMYLSFVGCCLYSCSYRSKLRHLYKLPKAPCGCGDCMVHFFCEPCALCQEYRELQNRGFNMAVGYKVNMTGHVNNARQLDMETQTAPATQMQPMTRDNIPQIAPTNQMPLMTHDDHNDEENDDDNDNN